MVVGLEVGALVGDSKPSPPLASVTVGLDDGALDGLNDGALDGLNDGLDVGLTEGLDDGALEGTGWIIKR